MTHDFRKEAEEVAKLCTSEGGGFFDYEMSVLQRVLRTAYERGVEAAAKVADGLAEENRRAEIHYARGGNDFAEAEAIAAKKECEAVASTIRALKGEP